MGIGLSCRPVTVPTRQDVPTLDRNRYASAEGLKRGVYILAEAAGVRRYGFSALSYEFLMEELARICDGLDFLGIELNKTGNFENAG